MPLTDAKVRTAKPSDKPKKLFDTNGLYLEVRPSGGRWWRFKYRFNNREKRISLGVYPDVTLKMARERRDDARRLVADGIDPSTHRQATKAAAVEQAANSFEAIAREWYAKQQPGWSAKHADTVIRRLESYLFPWLGARPITDITPAEVLKTVRRLESRGKGESAHRALGICGQVFRYAVASTRAESDPTRDLRGALAPVKPKHLPAVTEPEALGRLLVMLDSYQGTPVVSAALRLAPLVFVRPGELRMARWVDIDLEAAEWRFVVTKTQTQHIVPLASQAVTILADLEPLTGRGEHVFPSARHPRGDRPMSDNAVLAAFRRLGIPKDEMTGHGFRASARTILDEVLGFPPHLIEHQLAHAVRDPLGRAYNRTAHLPERRAMMQAWADYLDGLRAQNECQHTPD